MKKRITSLIMVLCLLVVNGCAQKEIKEITVQNVADICGIGSIGLTDRFSGIVVSEAETKIEKSETVQIKEILVKAGDTVKEGDTLFTYDNTQLEYTIEQAKLELEKQKLSLETRKQDKQRLEEEKKKAKDDQQLSYTLEIREIDAEILETEYTIKQKEQEIEKNEAAMGETSVESPVSGRIQAVNKESGYDDYGNPLPFISIVREGTFRIQGFINETNINALTEGTEVLIRSRVDEKTWNGQVESIDTMSGKTGNRDYDNESEAGISSSTVYPFYIHLNDSEGLILGQHVFIEPDYGQETEVLPDKICLPAYYLPSDEEGNVQNADEGKTFVYARDENGFLKKRNVTLGEYDDIMDTYIIEEGLSEDDYIAFPEEGIEEGMKCIVSEGE